MRLIRNSMATLAVALTATVTSQGAAADGNKPKPSIAIELNKLTDVSDACRMSLVIRNNLATSIDVLSLEIALFDAEGQIQKLIAANAGRLPTRRTRVKQFDIKSTRCTEIGRLLVNDVKQCKGSDVSPATCFDALRTKSRLSVSFIN